MTSARTRLWQASPAAQRMAHGFRPAVARKYRSHRALYGIAMPDDIDITVALIILALLAVVWVFEPSIIREGVWLP
jgi:hypothetical protein